MGNCIPHRRWNQCNHVTRLAASCKRGAVRVYSWDLPVLVLAYIDSSGSWSKAERERTLQTPLSHKHRSAAFHCLSECKAGCWSSRPPHQTPSLPSYSSLASSLHPQGQIASRLSDRFMVAAEAPPHHAAQRVGPAADPQIIIAIKHCFPNKMISLPLILCQSLFLFTSGRSNPGTALTRGKTQVRL